MRRPLYATPGAAYAPRDSHAGLWYDKFCDAWIVNGGRWSMATDAHGANPKHTWIQRVAGEVGRTDLLAETAYRQILLASACGGRFGVFTTEGRFVTGTGRSHPVENGFVWHPTLGTPYLPGSSIKGMIRAWAEETGKPPERITAAFGPDRRGNPSDLLVADNDDQPAGGAGRVIVFDAIPVKPPRVEADVLTPHYASWRADDPPGDWRSPVPIPFLVTAAGTEFLFTIAGAHRRTDAAGRDGDEALVRDVWDWLAGALGEHGAGAKTAVGYGRFAAADATTQALRQRVEARAAEARRAVDLATPDGRWRVELDGKSESDVVELVRRNLKENQLTAALDRRVFADVVLAGPFASHWRRGDARPGVKTGGKKLKELYNLLVAAINAQ
jgi:CRISPR-associated protein Cmr6